MKVYKASAKELFFYLLSICLCWQSTSALAVPKLHLDDWYLSQPDDSAAIQISGHKSESDAIAYIEKENLSGDVGYYRTQYKNLPWYAITYGNFASLDEARSHLKLLPNNLQQHSPWPRTFKAIKSLIDVIEPVAVSSDKTADNLPKVGSNAPAAKRPLKELNWEEGQAAYDGGDFLTAFNIWVALAEKGDELSQFNLGVMYSRGEGTEKSDINALKWYTKSAEQGYAPAQFNLGAVYLAENFTEEDATKAASWWQMAAEQGFVQAQFNIASLYCRGIGVSRDQEQCKFWYGRAASNGDTHARKMLDHLIQLENENKQKEAVKSATPVAAAVQSLNEKKLSTQKQKIKPEVRHINSEEHKQLARAQKAFTRGNYKKAHDIWLPLAESGIAEAQYSLGFLYQSGWGSEQDLLQAVAWYHSAAKQNEARAQFNLGVLLIKGEDEIDKDTDSGVLWLTRSAKGNNIRAKEFLINAYDVGMYGIKKSTVKAEYWKSR